MKRGFESFGIFVDYAIVAIIELCVMENLTLSPSALRSKKKKEKKGSREGRGWKAITCAQSFTKSANAV